jgi:glycyl-tRNA synthetase (class II)
VTIRDRNTMEQVRVPMALLPAVMEKLMAGQWSEVARESGVKRNQAQAE